MRRNKFSPKPPTHKRQAYNVDHDDNCSVSSEILSKLRDDISNLERLKDFSCENRAPSQPFKEYSTSRKRASSVSSRSPPSKSLSLDARPKRDILSTKENDAAVSSWQRRLRSDRLMDESTVLERDEFKRQVEALTRENEMLQTKVRTLKEDSIKAIQYNEKKLSDFNQAKTRTQELEAALREVISNIQSEQEMFQSELAVAYKLRQTETSFLTEKLSKAQAEIRDLSTRHQHKDGRIQELELEFAKELAAAKDSNNTSQGEVVKLQNQLNDMSLSLETQTSKAEALKQEKLAMEEATRDHRLSSDKAISELRCLLQEERDRSEIANSKLVKEQGAHRQLSAELTESKETIAELQAISNQANERMKSLEDKCQYLITDCENKDSTIIKLEDDLAKIHESKSLLEHELETLKSEMESERNNFLVNCQKNDESMKQLEDDLAKSHGSNSRLEQDICTLKSKLECAGEELNERVNEQSRLLSKISGLNEQMNEHSRLSSEKSERIEELKDECQSLEAELKSARVSLKDAKARFGEEKASTTKKCSKLEVDVGRLEEHSKAKQNEIDQLSERIEELRDKCQSLEAELKSARVSLKDSKAKFDEEKASITKKCIKLEVDVGRLEEHSKAKQNEIDLLTHQIRDIATEKDEQRKSLEALGVAEDRLQEEASRKEQNMIACEMERDRLKEVVEHISKEVKQLHEANALLKAKLVEEASAAEASANTNKTLQVELRETRSLLESTEEESRSRNAQLKSALSSLKEVSVLDYAQENTQAVLSLETELDKLLLSKQQTITASKVAERTMQLQDAEIKRLTEELETCRSDSLLEITAAKDQYIQKLDEFTHTKAMEVTEAQKLEMCKVLELRVSLEKKVHENDGLKDSLKRSQEAVYKFEQKAADLESLLETKRCELKADYQSALEKAQDELDTCNIAKNDIAAELRTSKEELEKIRASNESIESKHSELKREYDNKSKKEKTIRGELAQKTQMLSIVQSNEKALQEHVASLESQIDRLVQDYETKLKMQS
ncbi:hypothetical protein THAOC_09856 [Thalassiosira oceanica]|uniref:Uncharacterized protein n=1 Tax=Thalassiosira oceanica TaxID=159749 RepID=K0T6H8_THAOC|nr:hypothetical protein THAOC_09856 [Thalassiosira oceanica]|eukprot:EJK68931.1 hypothetical protein THAOC_09856 [Thalassiosira oceanica]